MKHTEESIQTSAANVGVDANIPAQEPDQAVSDAKSLITTLNGAIKSYTIYPKNHAIPHKYLDRLLNGLERFLAQFGPLRLTIEKGKLFFKDSLIHEDGEQESDVAYLLSRDGMKWIEFHQGIQPYEIEGFIELINEYRVITQVSDGDIVTAFWENDFPRIQYEAVDLTLKNGPPLDLSQYSAVDIEKLDSGETKVNNQESVSPSDISMADGKSFPLMEAGKDLWR